MYKKDKLLLYKKYQNNKNIIKLKNKLKKFERK